MQPIYFLLPHAKDQHATPIARWLEALPELKLMAPVHCMEIEWEYGVTGSNRDWLKSIRMIEKHWHDAHGFVVWAPQASLLELAGTASLMFEKAGKPVVFFASEYPDMSDNDANSLMGIKSQLINAVYIACADLGEVGVLIDHALYRPSACKWEVTGEGIQPVSVASPVATIDFQLHVHGDYHPRTNALQLVEQPGFEHALSFIAWYPGAASQVPAASDAVMVSTESVFWQHQAMQQLRRQIQSTRKPLIWYSQQPWPKIDWQPHEIGISHGQPWWAALVAQFAFAKAKQNPDQSLQLIETLIRI